MKPFRLPILPVALAGWVYSGLPALAQVRSPSGFQLSLSEAFEPLWQVVETWKCEWYFTDGYVVYKSFIEAKEHIVSKTAMTRVEGENGRLRHYLARLHRQGLCYSKTKEMLNLSIRLLQHYLKTGIVPTPP